MNSSDRCDRCAAQAYVRVELKAGELLFCGHHFAANELALVSAGALVMNDEREILLVKSSHVVG